MHWSGIITLLLLFVLSVYNFMYFMKVHNGENASDMLDTGYYLNMVIMILAILGVVWWLVCKIRHHQKFRKWNSGAVTGSRSYRSSPFNF